jgi:RsiW-degrading membrane proteinase PrsW (M82 family)|tara:strand:+ start:4117 stop:4923 length:807 start_codon:yes stop_codon:yes gene_type:complete
MSFVTIVILSFLPALLYSGLIYISVPYKIINLKKSIYYLIGGFMSVGILLIIYQTFPWIQTMGQKIFNPLFEPLGYLHFKFFIVVGLLEELSKLIAFLILERNNKTTNKEKPHPLATMFYVSMVSLGFAILENIKYAINSSDPGYVIALRSVTAVVGHLVFGLFMGYWLSFGRLKTRLKNRSILDIYLSKDTRLKVRVFTIVGLISATILHGIYDLHLTINNMGALTTLYMLLIMSVMGAMWCFRNLFRLEIKQKNIPSKKKLKTDTE